MIRLYKKDTAEFADFPNYIFSVDTTQVTDNSVIIDEVEYYLPSEIEKKNEMAELIKNWSEIPENHIQYIYFEGVEPDRNPSGKNNLDRIEYYNSDKQLIFTQLFEWNIDNQIIRQLTL